MSNSTLFLFGCAIFLLLAIAIGTTIVEFIKMDKHPESYKNPRYKK